MSGCSLCIPTFLLYLASENKAWGKGFRPEKDLKSGEIWRNEEDC